eukprot:TRINITY_DN383_c1_g4_i1.p1 TRINITY_DN383_c1_g4~~TRINITY_DN383_c1_g4_i1.p1  ORF type:complete len:668 (+),score=92.52 TRINITY_DN383_c1_g4_i1:925-2928(+)
MGKGEIAVVGERSIAYASGKPFVHPTVPASVPRSQVNTSFEIGEPALVRDLMFVLDGTNGRFLVLDVEQDCYRVDPKCGVPPAMRELAERLAECGWLSKRISAFADSVASSGLMMQAFCAALRNELVDYRRHIASLDSQKGSLTLRKLAVLLLDTQSRLRTLAILCDAVKGKRGGAVADALHAHTRHGSSSREVVHAVLQQVCVPLYVMIRRWVCEGVLVDPWNEFFVAADTTVSSAELWRRGYALRASMLPSFIGSDRAEKILRTGKSINFIRICCNDTAWVLDPSNARWPSLEYDDVTALDNAVLAAAEGTDKHLMQQMFEQFHLAQHINAIKRYMLLGQGDFIQVLMDLAGDELGKPAGAVLPHHLTAFLSTAIRGSNAQYDEAHVVNRVDARKLHANAGDSGWDVFSMDYHVDAPINSVLSTEAMQAYLLISNFLWRLKRVEHALSTTWQRSMTARSVSQLAALKPILHRCHMLRSEMIQFISTIQYYVMFEVLESSWQECEVAMAKAVNLDDLIKAHDHYINSILRRAMHHDGAKPLLQALHRIFDAVLKFRGIQDNLINAATAAVARIAAVEHEQKQREISGRWGVSDTFSFAPISASSDLPVDTDVQHAADIAAKQLADCASLYRTQLDSFRASAASHDDSCFRFIEFRLDFNEFYSAAQ